MAEALDRALRRKLISQAAERLWRRQGVRPGDAERGLHVAPGPRAVPRRRVFAASTSRLVAGSPRPSKPGRSQTPFPG
jgi:hypothetical protein